MVSLAKLLAALGGGVAFSIVSVLAPFATAQSQFNDIQGHWAQNCLEELGNRRILNGYPDGSFRPNASLTRAEFATVLEGAFSQLSPVRSQTEEFRDTRNHWAKRPIRFAFDRGFLTGYPDGSFQPNLPIPRVQALASLAGGLKYTPSQDVTTTLSQAFTDAATIPDYAKPNIAAAVERRIAVNYPNVKTFNPNRAATRGEVASFLCQAMVAQMPVSAIESRYVATAPIPEIRGVWLTNIDSNVLFSTANLRNGMNRLSRLNFNTIYPTVWNWGYTLYPSQVAEDVIGRSIDPEPGLQGRDMLQEAILEGKRHNIRVIPWFEFGFMAPSDSELAKRKPQWLTQRFDGTKTKMEGTHERVWMNPFHPEVQQFILDLVVEIASNYDIDGIQFDDHMGLPVEYGYDDYTVALYKQEHNGKAPPENKDDPEWVRWRADKITAFMERVFAAIKAANPDCIVAVSPNPQTFAYTQYLQDWQTWERKGLVEELLIQVYRDDLALFSQELEQEPVTTARDHIPVGIAVLTGLKNRPTSLDLVQHKVAIVRNQGFGGVSFFFYESMWNWADETPVQREAGFRELFPTRVSAPSVLSE
ncbi:MAG TPA: family 10 glycosylhydrolase [Oscillatoriales cyanobacterium M59_W2019_021]|nr:family 10 glycosylhydrolase [Oscillatoriales cyanobacterium M4454_W2019_049]HIK53327.1 family 10 glycosylhydrolase [Oscillatoriales cyanobacterium M59_W2019_021]